MSVELAERRGVQIAGHLPLLDPVEYCRTLDEIATRLLAVHAVCAVAFGFPRPKGIAWVEREELQGGLTSAERRFLYEGVGKPEDFHRLVEACWALAWVLRVTEKFDMWVECFPLFVKMLPDIKADATTGAYRANLKLRPIDEVAEMLDLSYCLHWYLRRGRVGGDKSLWKLREDIVVPRRHAFEWVTCDEPWDEISLDT